MQKQPDDDARRAMPIPELLILVIALGFCVWAWDSGGILGLVGCLCGAIVGFNSRSVLKGAFVGLWVGIVAGALFAGAIGRLVDLVHSGL